MRKANILPIKSDEDVVVARATGREFARDFGFNVAEQTRLATAISELTLSSPLIKWLFPALTPR